MGFSHDPIRSISMPPTLFLKIHLIFRRIYLQPHPLEGFEPRSPLNKSLINSLLVEKPHFYRYAPTFDVN